MTKLHWGASPFWKNSISVFPMHTCLWQNMSHTRPVTKHCLSSFLLPNPYLRRKKWKLSKRIPATKVNRGRKALWCLRHVQVEKRRRERGVICTLKWLVIDTMVLWVTKTLLETQLRGLTLLSPFLYLPWWLLSLQIHCYRSGQRQREPLFWQI